MYAASLGKIRKLYAIEEEIKGLTAPEKKVWRQEDSKRLLDDLNQWSKVVVYCEDGHLNISNAAAENAIRPFTVRVAVTGSLLIPRKVPKRVQPTTA